MGYLLKHVQLLVVALVVAYTSSCFKGPAFMQSKSAANSVKEVAIETQGGEAVSAALGANSSVAQKVSASAIAELSGTEITFPPGALSVSTKVTIEQGATIASSSVASTLGLDSGTVVSQAGPAVTVNSSTSMNTLQPFSLSIPISSSSSLALDDDSSLYVVIFKVVDADSKNNVLGIIPNSEISISNGLATFKTSRFGSFQVAKSNVAIKTAKEVKTETPILTKNQEKALPAIVFGKIEMTISAASKKEVFSATLSGMNPSRCGIIGSSDKKKICGSGVPKYSNGLVVFDTSDDSSKSKDSNEKGQGCGDNGAPIYVKIDCEENGRNASSGWSDAFTLPKRNNGVAIITSPSPGSYASTANHTAFAVAGTCTDTSRGVTIVAKGINTRTSCVNGSWTISLDVSSFSEGDFTVAADQSDGDSTNGSTDLRTFLHDSTSPTVSISSPLANTVVNAATHSAFAVAGSCSENGSVTLTYGTSTATASCSGGNWSTSLDVSSLSDTSFALTVSQVDAAGNGPATASRSFIHNSVAPTVAITSPTSGAPANSSNHASFNISGTCTANGQSVTLSGAVSATASCSSGSWSANIDVQSVSQGTFTIYADLTDSSGNPANQVSRAFIHDSTSPTVAFTTAVDTYASSSNESSFTIAGTCSENGRSVGITAGSSSATATCSSGNWSATINVTSVSQGNFNATADLTDAAGNAATQATRRFIHDSTAPNVTFTLPAVSSYASAATNTAFPLGGTCSENGRDVAITISTINTTATCSGGNWSKNVDVSGLSETSLTINISHSDAAGNSINASRSFTHDKTAPAVAITSPTAGSYASSLNDASFSVSGSCSSSGGNVTVAVGANSTTTACSGGNWTKSLDVSATSQGSFTVTVDQSDTAGNTAVQATRSFTHDSLAPFDIATFDVFPGHDFGSVDVQLNFPGGATAADYTTIAVRYITGATPPASCSAGTQLFTNSSRTSGTTGYSGLTAGNVYSYRLCLTDAAGNINSNMTKSNIPAGAHTIFVSSATYNGNLKATVGGASFSSGLEGADYRCQQLATTANLNGTWVALLSDSNTDLKYRVKTNFPVFDMMHNYIASGPNLWDGTISNKVGYSETGTAVTANANVWTGSSEAGLVPADNINCHDWTSTASGNYGRSGQANGSTGNQWLNYCYNAGCTCNTAMRLYCINQPSPGLRSFTASAYSAGAISIAMQFPTAVDQIGSVKIYRATGSTPPPSDCMSGTLVNTYNSGSITSDVNITYSDTGVSTGNFYSYRACVFDTSNMLITSSGTSQSHTLFVTAATYTGASVLGRVNADSICQSAASAASLSGTYKALLSDSSFNANTLIKTGSAVKDIFGNFLGSASGFFSTPLMATPVTQVGAAATGFVFTGSTSTGTFSNTYTCSEWSLAIGNAKGASLSTISNPTSGVNWAAGSGNCGTASHLFCISQ